jgi:hypothetical protein
MVNPVDVEQLRLRIEALRRDYPDLDTDEVLLSDMLEGATDIATVLTELHRHIDDAKALRDGTAERLDELKDRKTRFDRRMQFYRDLILRVLETANLRKVELPEATLSLRNNPPQLIGDPDPNELPDEFVKVRREPDKAAIRSALEAGRAVPGFVLNNAPPSLTIRVK